MSRDLKGLCKSPLESESKCKHIGSLVKTSYKKNIMNDSTSLIKERIS